MRWLMVPVVILFFFLMMYATSTLPDRGDPEAPAATHVVPYYVEHSLEETETPNIVTSVLADYRGYDTLGETIVIFTAGLAAVLIMRKQRSP